MILTLHQSRKQQPLLQISYTEHGLKVYLCNDILYIHDTGAHGHAMGYNYNGKLRSAELLLKEDGSVELLRRAETEKDYFAVFDFTGLFW